MGAMREDGREAGRGEAVWLVAGPLLPCMPRHKLP